MTRSTRERLLDAGLLLFARDGLAATAVTDLEAEAGLRPGSGSFYRHFPSKDDLFTAVLLRELERVGAAAPRPPGDVTAIDPRVALTLEFRRLLDTLERLEPAIHLFSRNRAAVVARLAEAADVEAFQQHFALDTGALQRLMDAGRIPRRDVGALAGTVAAAVVGYHASNWFLGAPFEGTGADAFIATLVDLVVT